jgi:hypothetical protein
LGGRGDGLHPSAAKAVMGGLNSRGFFERGRESTRSIKQQSTSYLLLRHTAGRSSGGDSVGVAFVELCWKAFVGGSGKFLMIEMMFVAWSLVARLVGCCCCCVDGSSVCACVVLLCHNDRFRNLNHSIP